AWRSRVPSDDSFSPFLSDPRRSLESVFLADGRRARQGARSSGCEALHRRLQPPPVEAQAVPREQLLQVLAGVRPGPGDVPHAVGEHAVPVPVVGAEAGDVLAPRAQCLAQVGRCRIVGLAAHEDLPAPEEVDRLVVKGTMLVEKVVGVVGAPVSRGSPVELKRLAQLAPWVSLAVGADALAQQLAGEAAAPHAD